MPSFVSRRRFLQEIAVASAAMPLATRALQGQAGRKVRHASFGASGMALSDIRSFSSHPAFDLIAVADADLSRTEQVKKLFPNVRVYQDWRELLRKEADNLDSVNVSTPDHMHAPIAMAAMSYEHTRQLQQSHCPQPPSTSASFPQDRFRSRGRNTRSRRRGSTNPPEPQSGSDQ